MFILQWYIVFSNQILNEKKNNNITLIGDELTSSQSNICTIHVMFRARGTFFCVSNANESGYT